VQAKTTQQQQSNAEIIAEISKLLSSHVESGLIDSSQLLKIKDLATSPERLKNALRWL
jgi:hypothetical protein